MLTLHSGDITWFQFPSLAAHGERVTHGVFARHGGVSRPPFATLNAGPAVADDPAAREENYARIRAALPGQPLLVGTTPLQGSTLIEITPEMVAEAAGPAVLLAGGCDAFITRTPNLGLFWAVADCATVLLYDQAHAAIGLTHAGWRGTRDTIVLKTIAAMQVAYGTQLADLIAAIGPTIGPCCYEVDTRVFDEFQRDPIARETAAFSTVEVPTAEGGVRESLRLDLSTSNRQQLLVAGLAESQIETSEYCPGSRRDLFFSHRMEGGNTGRFAVVLGLRV